MHVLFSSINDSKLEIKCNLLLSKSSKYESILNANVLNEFINLATKQLYGYIQ